MMLGRSDERKFMQTGKKQNKTQKESEGYVDMISFVFLE